MAFYSIDEVVNALSNGFGQAIYFSKQLAQNNAANIPHNTWLATGFPAAGTNTSAGAANGRTLLDSTTGGYPYNNAGGSRTMHLMGLEAVAISGSAQSSLVLVDRICDVNMVVTNAGATSFTGMSATSRLAATEGAKLWIEVTTTIVGTPVFTFGYTNEAGTASRSVAVTASANQSVGKSFNENVFQKLQAGDNGIRSLDTVTVTGGATTGNINICLVRPLATLPLTTACVSSARSFISEVPNLPVIYPDTCFNFIMTSVSATTQRFTGRIILAEN